ncbi:MAG: hypothetical protein QM722_02555 [Piscinibacter sp.]
MDHGQVATLVRALARLRSGAADDAALLDALAALTLPAAAADLAATRRAGDAVPPRKPTRPASPAPDLAVSPGPAAAAPLPVEADAEPSARPRPRAAADGQLVAEPSALQLLVERADLITPERSPAGATAQAPARAEAANTSAPLESLFAAGRVRGILREMSTLASASGAPDIAAVVRRIARAEPITRLPRLRVSTLGHAVLWLFDAGPAMLPFASDKQQLAATATRLLGRDRVRIADFIGDPLQAVRAQRQVRWSALHWPPRGSALVVVSDLGLGGRESTLNAAAWRRFQQEARRRGLRSVLLIPYEQARWPDAAAGFDTTLAWDLASGVQALRRRRRLVHRG